MGERGRDARMPWTSSAPLSFLADDLRARAAMRREAGDARGEAAVLAVLSTLLPDDRRVWMSLAYARVRAGRTRAAAEAYLEVAVLDARGGCSRRALTAARRALSLDPVSATPARLEPLARRLGATAAPILERSIRNHLLLRRPDIARELLRLLLRIDPAGLDRRWQLVELELAEGDWVDAVDQLHLIATGLLRQGRISDFVRAARMALKYGGPNASLLRELARVYRRTGQRALALQTLVKLDALEGGDPEVLEALARGHIEAGAIDAGFAALGRLVEIVADQGTRQDVRALLGRAERWCDDEAYTRRVDHLRVEQLMRRPPTSPPAVPTRTAARGRVASSPAEATLAHPRA